MLRAYREKGDRRALERLFAMHGGLLKSITRRYRHSSGEQYEDLLQVGHVGLMKAVNGYEANSEAKFSSYAHSMMEGELRHYLRDSSLVKKPRWARSLYAKVSQATAKLMAELGRPPLAGEIAREVNVEVEGINELIKLYLHTDVRSLDEPCGDGDADLSAIKNLAYEAFALPIEDRIWLEGAMESLSEIQKEVIHLFFYKDLTQTEIGKKLGLSQRKVSRLVASAIKKLSKSGKDDRGFTLPELMIVIVLLGILAAIAIPSWWELTESRRVETAANQVASDMRLAHGKATNRLERWEFKAPAQGGPINAYTIQPFDEFDTPGELQTRNLTESRGTKFGTTGTTINFCSKGTAQTTPCTSYTMGTNTELKVMADDGCPSYAVRVNAQTSNVRVSRGTCPP